MVNPDYNILKDWMFGKLSSLLENIEPNPKYSVLKMSLGEPSLEFQTLQKNILDLNYNDWAKYPPTDAIPSFGKSIMSYIKKTISRSRKTYKLKQKYSSLFQVHENLCIL